MTICNYLFNCTKIAQDYDEYFSIGSIFFKITAGISSNSIIKQLSEDFELGQSLLSVGKAYTSLVECVQKRNVSSGVEFAYHFIEVSQLSFNLFPLGIYSKVVKGACAMQKIIAIAASVLEFFEEKGKLSEPLDILDKKITVCKMVKACSAVGLSQALFCSIILGVELHPVGVAVLATTYAFSIISKNYYSSQLENL